MRKLSIEVRGHERTWSFEFDGDPRFLAEWRADGLNICEIVNTIPASVVDAGLLRAWIFAQDLLYGAFLQRLVNRLFSK